MRITKQQRANLVEALEVMWPSVPEKNVNLGTWRREPWRSADCGTIACFGGWCALWPSFQAQGVTPHPMLGAPVLRNWRGGWVAEELFGDGALFTGRGGHWVDFEGGRDVSDWEVVRRRLQFVLSTSLVGS